MSVNDYINKYYDASIEELLEESISYKDTKSYNIKFNKCFDIIKKYIKNVDIVNKCCEELMNEFITAGSKGANRGHQFNIFIKNTIMSMGLSDTYNVKFEEQHPTIKMDEIPDWYIEHTPTKNILFGNNKLDIWNGGQQTQIASAYIKYQNHVIVICRKKEFKTTNSKAYKIMNYAITHNKITYPSNLYSYIQKHFALTGLKRNPIDQFYTHTNIAEECIHLLQKYVYINNTDLVIEPSAGNGAFSDLLRKMYANVIAIDISPNNEYITEQDFFTLSIDNIYSSIHVIGNPPFGRQSSLAKRFIKKCVQLNSDTISFILPKSFKKNSNQKTFPLNYHLLHSYDLPANSFHIDNNVHNVSCVFQIWKKMNTHRFIENSVKPDYYIYTTKDGNPDVTIRRVGVNTGLISIYIDDKSSTSHYFLKFIKKINIDHFINWYKTLKFDDTLNTVGPKSLSKPELDNKLVHYNNEN